MDKKDKDKIINKYSENKSQDDPTYIYSIRNKIGFYQKLILKKHFIRILNRNNIRVSSFMNIVDLGCGEGYWLREIADIRGNSGGLTGIDISPDRIEKAQNINNNIHYQTMDILSNNLRNDYFDFVIAFDLFMFLKDNDALQKGFYEIFRILKKGGYFLFFDIIGKKKENELTRGFKKIEIIKLSDKNRFTLIDKQYVYKKIFGLKIFNTAYLAKFIPLEILLILEKLFFFPSNNMFLLFKK